ncbi:centrosomal protein of 104 kDa isoform X4 [Neofelis nebulosa]|uniref:centrosomal protein of 104 kDa isoform X4 n=1 Tax=Neofelis nebulosa TaxID=61452 RepID=UPI00272BEAED|nr:centrosomal protein of 104 kDa isoform X4 [Neofelis nebulosa]
MLSVSKARTNPFRGLKRYQFLSLKEVFPALTTSPAPRMPHKIGFVVVSSSGHEDGFSARELMIHAPTVSGWRSPRFCRFPQEIVLQMVERCRIRKLQLLAHQYMIPSKVEFYVSESLPEYFVPYQAERFRRLGYVSLCDNEKTGCRARELKSVYVDAVGQFLKLTFHENHLNKYNIYNQVALVAVNIIGDPADFGDESNITSREKLIDHYLGHNTEDPALEGTCTGKSDYISPLDDLAFDMYQDPEVAQIIRKLDERKREAVQKERYDYAKKLKQAIADLQKVGERLGRYEVEKRCAVEKEDYDRAKEKQQQMERFRGQVYEQLRLHSLVDAELVQRPPDLPLQPLAHSGSPHHQQPALSRQREDRAPESLRAEPFLQEKPPARPLGPPQPATADQAPPSADPHLRTHLQAVPYDERPLPAARKQPAAALEPEKSDWDGSEAPRGAATGEPEPLTEKALREASPAVDVLGEALVAGAYSKTWSYREDALLALCKQLMQMPAGAPKEELKNVLRASIFLVRRAVRDLVTPVFQASLKLLKMIITQYIPKHKLSKLETAHCVERTVPVLLTRTGDSSARLRVIASNFIQEMALFKEVRSLQIIPPYLVQPLKANSSAHLAMSQMDLLARLLRDLGTGNTGFTVDNVMKETMAGPVLEADSQDTEGGKAAARPAPEVPAAHYLDNLCIFCGERSESFTEEGLDLHYWKRCLMLTRCACCRQVVEISSLTEHLLTECDKKDGFGKCYRCNEAVLKEELPRHIKAKDCNPAKPEKLANRCPLCHENFSPGEEAWKAHLMGPAGCTMNLRKTHVLRKALPPAGKGPATTKSGTSASKVGSKIPTPKGLNKSSGRTYTKR